MNGAWSVQEQKSFFRKELRKKLAGLGPRERTRRSQEILRKLLSHPKFLAAEKFFTYIALECEVQTRPIVEEGRRRGKRVYVPRVEPAKKRIAMMEIIDWKELKPGAFGILEPAFDPKRLGRPEDLGLAVVPGLGFDRRGGRLGRGEGYFDRFLAEAKKAYKVGLAFEFQIVDEVPREAKDVSVDEVIIG